MRIIFILLLAVTSRTICTGEESANWQPIFNGQDLTCWTPKIRNHPSGENFAETFRVEDGILKVAYDKYEGPFRGRFGHLFYDEEFSHYVLRLEYRIVGEQYEAAPGWALRNSGVMIHGQEPETMAIDQQFPASIEVQLLGGDGTNPRSTANLCTPGTNVVIDGILHTDHCTSSCSETYHGEQWVRLEIEVRGNRIFRHKINGQTVMEYTEPQLDPEDEDAQRLLEQGAEQMLSKGTISLQSEGHPVEFRKIELKVLDE